jgi:hypothetical protein
MNIGSWLESQQQGDLYEDRDLSGRIILRWILELYDGVEWTGLIWLTTGTSAGLL